MELIKFKTEEIIPAIDDITLSQGIPRSHIIKESIRELIDKSLDLFHSEADPLCIIRDISIAEFDEIFRGDGNNEEEAPLKNIYPQADHLTMFAATMGSRISRRISGLFSDNDFALASILDSVASLAADNTVELLEEKISKRLTEEKPATGSNMVLNYSPGYCGWNIGAQKKLFSYIHPEQIGISLNDSCLMTPLKSVTGVLVSGNKNIHDFDNSFSFCCNCKAQSCIERREKILSH